MPHVSEEDRGTRAGGKSQLKAVMLLIFIHLFSLDMYPPLVGVDLRLRTLCGEIAGQHADTQNSCFSNGKSRLYSLKNIKLPGVDRYPPVIRPPQFCAQARYLRVGRCWRTGRMTTF